MIEPSMIKMARITLGLTQKELAIQSGVSQSLIAKIEAGSLDPTYSRIKQIDAAIKKLTIKSEKVAIQVMTKKVIFTKTDESVLKVIKLMAKNSISQIPVMENNKVVGLVTESSILENITKKDFNSLDAREIMIESPPVISKDTPVSIVTELLKYSSIVLVSEKGILLGVITKADILQNKV